MTILTIGTFETALSFGVFNFYDFATWHFKFFSILSALFYIEVSQNLRFSKLANWDVRGLVQDEVLESV